MNRRIGQGFARSAGWAIASAAILAIAYGSIFGEYAFSDDYTFLHRAATGHGWGKLVDAGRPLFAIWARAAYGLAHDVHGLRLVRAGALAVMLALSLVLAHAFQRAGWPRAEAHIAGLLAALLPSNGIQVAWGATCQQPVAACAALLAGRLTAAGVSAERDGGRGRQLARALAAGALVFASLALHQTEVGFFWIGVAIAVLGSGATATDGARIVRRALVVFAASFAAYGLLYLGLVQAGVLNAARRGGLLSEPWRKFGWFVVSPLRDAVALHAVMQPLPVRYGVSLLVAGLAAVAIARLAIASERRDAPWIIGLAAMLPFLAHATLLVLDVNAGSFRSEGAISVAVLLLALVGLRALLATRPRARGATFAFVGLAAVLLARRDLDRGFVAPQVTEWSLLRAEVARMPARPPRLAIRRATLDDRLARVRYDEYGVPSSAQRWAILPMAWLLLRDRFGDGSATEIDVVAPDAAAPAGVPLLDPGALLRAFRHGPPP